MSKIQSKRIKQIIVLGALIGLILSLFFIKKEVFGGTTNDLLQGLLNTIDGNSPTEKIFEGNAMVENIYKKALKGQDRKEANKMNMSLDKITLLNKSIVLDKKDMLNILYNSNKDIKQSIDFLQQNSKNNYKPSTKDINNSYEKAFPELQKAGILKDTNNNAANKQKVNNWLNSQFIISADNESFLKEFDEKSLGEDLFINGSSDDSDYDLQIDIQNIGDILFESFIAPIETVFYKLPPSYKGSPSSSNNNGNDTPTNREELTNLIQNTINPASPINTGVITNGGSTPSNNNQITRPNTQNQITKNTDLNDTSLQNFAKDNALSQQATTQQSSTQGNICIDGVDAGSATELEQIDETSINDIEDYLENTQQQINNYNNIYTGTTAPNIKDNPAFSGMTPSQQNQFIEDYISDLFNVESTQSCLNSCNSLPISERTICQIQCLCFSMVWPDNPDLRVKSMNEMLKLRFCMVPADSMAIPRGKDIYSLDDILTRIYSNINNLINNGEMVKFQKTKEYLDNPIADLKFDKIISFQMNLNMKPIFNNKSEMAKKDQKETYIQKLEKISGKEQTLGVDYNKYLVIQDTAKNKAYKEYAPDLESYQENYTNLLKEMDSRKNKVNTNVMTNSIDNIMSDEKSKSLSTIADFLDQNLNFREQTEKEIQNLNNIIFSIQSRL